MILIYTQKHSARLDYILKFIIGHLLGVEHTVTHNRADFAAYTGARVNYSNESIPGSLSIPQAELLFESVIKPQPVFVTKKNGIKILYDANGVTGFNETDDSYQFDIFAAAFYLVSRYEEYLPHEKDFYGRYAHTSSLAFREEFLHLPLVNIWANDLGKVLRQKYQLLPLQPTIFTFIPTYDIDIAYAYKGKGLVRNAGGITRSLIQGRTDVIKTGVKTLLFNNTDPFDVYSELDELHEHYHLKPLYFFLVAGKNGVYDKNILPSNKKLGNLIKNVAKKYDAGLHPSWQSGDNSALLIAEKKKLEELSGKLVTFSRQHYIRFELPAGYRTLLAAGISNDYSMGYGSINGFRSSVASPHNWFDLEKNEPTSLLLFPFCYMEANSFYEQKLSAEAAYEEMLHYYNVCKNIGGTLVMIWHNHMLGRDKMYAGWKEVYFAFLKMVAARE